MSVRIDDLTIRDYYINTHERVLSLIVLEGEAPEEAGRRIFRGLKRYRIRDAVQFVDEVNPLYSGMYEIVRMELSKEGGIPAIYKFNMELRRC